MGGGAEVITPPTPAPGDSDLVVLVDGSGRAVGSAPKLAAHRAPGLLHRAFSVFVFTSDGRLLIQRRAPGKYHFAGLWSNSCCSHPRPGEDTVDAAARRLAEELGIECALGEVATLVYEARDEVSGLVEHEMDHLLVGTSDAVPSPDPAEVADVRLVTVEWLLGELAARPRAYTPWLARALALVHPPGGARLPGGLPRWEG